MANNQLIQAPSGITKTNSLDSFTLFPKLLAELRIMIWEFSFVPHHVVVMGAGHRPQRSQITGAHLLVNFEARQVFLENYTRCFHNLGQKAVYFNFSIDTLCVNPALKGLQELVKQYPDEMSQIQWIDANPERRDTLYPQWSRIDLSALTSCKQITLRWTLGTSYNGNYYGHWDESDMMSMFDHFKNSLSRSPGPKLAVMYPCQERPDNIYLETSADLTHGSFGTFQTDTPNLLRELDVDWIEREQPWAGIEESVLYFRAAIERESEPGSYNNTPQMAMQQVAAPVALHRGLGWFKSVLRCFL